MKVSKNELVLITEGIPGSLTFQNYEMVKEYLRIGLADYNGVVYSADNMEEARQDLETLKGVKKKLDDKKKELQKQYNKPYLDVEKQIDELIKMVKVPLDIVDRFIKDTESMTVGFLASQKAHNARNVRKYWTTRLRAQSLSESFPRRYWQARLFLMRDG